MKAFLSILMSLMALAATATDYVHHVGDFSTLKVSDNIPVDYRCSPDSAGLVTFTANDSVASQIAFTTDGTNLRIHFTERNVRPARVPVVTVYSRYLSDVTNEGDSLVRVLSVAPGASFSATQVGNGGVSVHNVEAGRVKGSLMSGNGQVILAGKCDVATLKMTGTGIIQADALQAATVKCTAVGTGQIGCAPEKELSVHGVGSTTIYYSGTPQIRNRALGVKLVQMQ